MSDLYIEARLQAIKGIASASCQDKKDIENIASFCDEIHEKITETQNKAIDDLIAKCKNAKFVESDEIVLSDIHQGVNSGLSMAIHFAEQLKAGGKNE